MANWAVRCDSVWLDVLLAAAIVTGFSALAMVQSRQPARRRIWGRFGLIGSLLVVPLVTLAPLPRVDLRHPTWSFWQAEPRAAPVHSARFLASAGPSRGFAQRADQPVTIGNGASSRPWCATIERGLLFVYGCGVALGLGRLGLGLIGVSYLVRRAQLPSARAAAFLAQLPFAAASKRRPRLLVAERAGRPVLLGMFRPVILIPSRLDKPEAGPQLRLGLLHELAHAEMTDHQFALVAELANVVWFFLPQVWWIQSQLRLDAEFLADHRAVGHFGTSYGYAASLVGLAAPAANSGRPAESTDHQWSLPSPLSHQSRGLASSLFQRVQMLLKCPFQVEDQAPRAWTGAVGLVAALGVLAASCLSIRDRDNFATQSVGRSMLEAARVFHLAELVIAPQRVDDRPFDLRFRLPERFNLACDLLAGPAELAQIEILGYHLGPAATPPSTTPGQDRSTWRRVEIVRQHGGLEAVHVDGAEVVSTHRPHNPAAWLTIRSVPGRTTRLRDLHLTY